MPLTAWLKRISSALFANQDLRKAVLVPVMVNLTTALCLFVAVAIFRDTIYERLLPRPKVTGFPIYCVAEGYNDEKGKVIGEIYIINRTQDGYDEKKLVDFLKKNSSEQQKNFDATIHIKWLADRPPLNVTEDARFNQGKGKLDIAREGRVWTIRILKIADKAILRVLVTTDLSWQLDRASRSSLPFEIDYGGE